jgi:hypothetical protein
MKAARIMGVTFALVLAPALWACNDRDEAAVETPPASEITTTDELRVVEVDLGNAIGADKRLTTAGETDDFSPTETIYAVVATEGSATGSTLTARWTFEDGQVVDETSQPIAATGPAVTEFHISKADGMPVGKYQVEILLDGRSIEKKDFEVK